MPEDESTSTQSITETINWARSVIAKHRWGIVWLSGPLALGIIGGLYLLPNRYTSEATLLVVKQQVPERYVVPNDTTDLTAALEAMKREVLSRPRLLKIVDDFNLYEKERKRQAPETIVELMLRDIEIEPLDENPLRKDFTAFKISFVANTPLLAQRVASTLTTLFINENLKSREQQDVTTTTFLHNEVEQKRQALDVQEKRLRDLKLQFIGELPEQQDGNLAIIGGIQTQLQSTEAALSRAQEERVYLESMLSGYLAQATENLNQLRSKRAKLLETYTPEYRAVVELDKDIAKAEKLLNELSPSSSPAAGKPASAKADNSIPPVMEQPVATQIRSQLDENRLEMQHLSQDEARLKAQIAQYQTRLNETPVREQQLLAVNREVEQLRQEYTDLEKKEQESQLATNLERNQGGQQFRLVDPPSLPAIPSSPKRLKMSLGGIAAALGIGLALALLLELKDPAFYTESAVKKTMGAALVIALPLVLTPAEKTSRRWKTAAQLAFGILFTIAVGITELYVYRHG